MSRYRCYVLSDPYRYGTGDDGTGVDIYIVDTGIKMDHEDFGNRVEWGMTANFTAGTGEENTDLDGHGTHVAGTCAGNKQVKCSIVVKKMQSGITKVETK